jgi:hypothetical protein
VFCLSWSSKLLSTLALLFVALASQAQSVDFAWDVPADLTGIGGYELHYGDASGVYSGFAYFPGANTAFGTLSVVVPPKYVAVRAANYDTAEYSTFSNELFLAAEATSPLDPLNFGWSRTYDGDPIVEPDAYRSPWNGSISNVRIYTRGIIDL